MRSTRREVLIGGASTLAIVKLDPRTNRRTFYPMPQPNQSLPKFEVAGDNTLWFGSRGVPIIAAVHFYPNGYSTANPPLP